MFMQTYIVNKTEHSAMISFKDVNLTIIMPIMDALYHDKNVLLVRYIEKHPELADRSLFIQVIDGDPIKAIESASKRVAEYYSKIYE